MKVRLLGIVGAGVLLAGVAVACGGGGGAAKGKAVFAISDAAADMGAVTSVKITVESLRVHSQGGAWTEVSTKAQTYDLLQLKAKGTAQLLAQADLDAGAYDQMELNISKVVVTDKKGEQEAKLPSGKLQIKGALSVQASSTATANLDVLADQSVHVTGNGRYILAPVIHVETKSGAQAQVQSNNEVKISGGSTTANTIVGMDLEGNVGVGLKIAPTAVLDIQGSGKVVQSKGDVIVTGVVKSVDTASGTVTLTTKGGQEVTVRTGASANVQPGSEIVASFDAETKGSAKVDTVAQVQAAVQGTLGVVGGGGQTPPPTATRAAASPAPTVAAATVTRPPPAATATPTGSGATATVSGTLKAVGLLANTVTIAAQGGAEVVLNLTAQSKVTVNGSASTTAALATMVGKASTAEYSAETKAVITLNVQG